MGQPGLGDPASAPQLDRVVRAVERFHLRIPALCILLGPGLLVPGCLLECPSFGDLDLPVQACLVPLANEYVARTEATLTVDTVSTGGTGACILDPDAGELRRISGTTPEGEPIVLELVTPPDAATITPGDVLEYTRHAGVPAGTLDLHRIEVRRDGQVLLYDEVLANPDDLDPPVGWTASAGAALCEDRDGCARPRARELQVEGPELSATLAPGDTVSRGSFQVGTQGVIQTVYPKNCEDILPRDRAHLAIVQLDP